MTIPVPARSPDQPGSRGAPSRAAGSLPSFACLGRIDRGVVEALAYADVFDWPLRAAEIHRYLPVEATLGEVESALESGAPSSHLMERTGDLAMLRDRHELAGVRQRRASHSAALWPRAISWARIVGRLPFVRMVAVTGSLAVGAARERDDIDLFVVTADGRLWLTRAMTMAVVRGARLRGLRLCPNYLIAASAIDLRDRSLYAARELVQMVPVTGGEAYAELMAGNAWYRDYLPNAEPAGVNRGSRRNGRLRRLLEKSRSGRKSSIDSSGGKWVARCGSGRRVGIDRDTL